MELEKYIERAKNAINGAYFDIQDALINYDRSLENLKSKGWKTDETAYQQEYQEIVSEYKNRTSEIVTECRAVVKKWKDSYMKEVDEFYRSDGSKLDLNFMNLIKAEIPMTAKEIIDVIEKNKDNLTMLRVVYKYMMETNVHLPEYKRVVLDNQYTALLQKSIRHGETEEKIFDSFTHLAMMGMNHPDKTFTLYQAHLDEYKKDAVLELLKAKLFIDDETKEQIEQIEEEQRIKNNDVKQGKDCAWYHGYL